jgi:hypothetical protein
MIQEIFTGADEIMAKTGENIQEKQTTEVAPIDEPIEPDTEPIESSPEEPEKASSQGDDNGGLSDFQVCVAKTYAEITEVDKGPKLCIAAKMCGKNTAMSKEDAIAACKGREKGANKNGN